MKGLFVFLVVLTSPIAEGSWSAPETKERKRFSGIVVDVDGNPVAGAKWGANVRGTFDVRGVTQSDGMFSGEVRSEALRLFAEAEGYSPLGLSLTASHSWEKIKMVLKRGINFSVRCVNEEGRPVSGCNVKISGRDIVTDAEGSVRFPALPDGDRVGIELSAPGYQFERRRNVLVKEQSQPLLYMLKKASPFEITVVDEESGKPLKGVHLSIQEARPKDAAYPWDPLVTNETGRATREGLRPDVSYRLQAHVYHLPQSEICPNKKSFWISPGKKSSLEIRLPKERHCETKSP